jgi:hypothetical protein
MAQSDPTILRQDVARPSGNRLQMWPKAKLRTRPKKFCRPKKVWHWAREGERGKMLVDRRGPVVRRVPCRQLKPARWNETGKVLTARDASNGHSEDKTDFTTGPALGRGTARGFHRDCCSIWWYREGKGEQGPVSLKSWSDGSFEQPCVSEINPDHNSFRD